MISRWRVFVDSKFCSPQIIDKIIKFADFSRNIVSEYGYDL